MSLSKAAEATRYLLKLYKEAALDGSLTTDEVIALVRERVPGAHASTIYNAIGAYGPVGEGDAAWSRRADLPSIPSWFYNPKTGESLDPGGTLE